MFGAARALVLKAAAAPLRQMSAQAIFAAISPAAAPQGASPIAVAGDDGPDFAALVQSEAATPAADGASVDLDSQHSATPVVDEAAPVADGADPAQTQTADSALGLLLVAQAPVALPEVVAASAVAAPTEGEEQAGADHAGELVPDPSEAAIPGAPQPVDSADAAELSAPQKDDRRAPTVAPLTPSATSKPEATAATDASRGSSAAEDPAPAKTAEAVDAAAPAPEQDGAQLKGKPAPADAPPLRALAERTSRPLDAAAPALDGQSRAESQRPEGAAAPQAAGAPVVPAAAANSQAKSARAEASTASPTAAAADASAAPLSEPQAADIKIVAQDAVRDAAAGLSRVAVEATAQIAAQILRKLEGRSTRFEMALLPEELGRVDVKLDIDSEGRLHARLAFDNPAAALDLRGRVDDLRRQLEQHGFELAADAFEFAERDPGSHAFDRGDEHPGRGRAFAAAARLEADAEVAAVSRYNVSLSPSGVDVRV